MHYVAAALITSNVILYADSLKPVSKPKVQVIAQMEASFQLKKKYTIRSLLGQRQRLSDWLPFATANLDNIMPGCDISKVQFQTELMRPNLVKSLINEELSFPKQVIQSRESAKMYSRQLSK